MGMASSETSQKLQSKFVVAGLGCRNGLLRNVDFRVDFRFSFFNSVNSDEAVSSTIRLKAFISKAFHGLSKSLKMAVIKVGEPIYEVLDFLLTTSFFNLKIEAFNFYKFQKEAVIKVVEPIYEVLDFLLNSSFFNLKIEAFNFYKFQKKAVIKVVEPIYEVLDFLLNPSFFNLKIEDFNFYKFSA
ncbi:hypothetical protein CFP56_036459 [Quercus suber]|uniref:Uncharacterized protein n=1 Tax=Quercus suber TaxID=58331 RepID=A0AAW0J7M4_QUESU